MFQFGRFNNLLFLCVKKLDHFKAFPEIRPSGNVDGQNRLNGCKGRRLFYLVLTLACSGPAAVSINQAPNQPERGHSSKIALTL